MLPLLWIGILMSVFVSWLCFSEFRFRKGLKAQMQQKPKPKTIVDTIGVETVSERALEGLTALVMKTASVYRMRGNEDLCKYYEADHLAMGTASHNTKECKFCEPIHVDNRNALLHMTMSQSGFNSLAFFKLGGSSAVMTYIRRFHMNWRHTFFMNAVIITHIALQFFKPRNYEDLREAGFERWIIRVESVCLVLEILDHLVASFIVFRLRDFKEDDFLNGKNPKTVYIAQTLLLVVIFFDYILMVAVPFTIEYYLPLRGLLLIAQNRSLRRAAMTLAHAISKANIVMLLYFCLILSSALMALVLFQRNHDDLSYAPNSFGNFPYAFIAMFVYFTGGSNFTDVWQAELQENQAYVIFLLVLALIGVFFVMAIVTGFFLHDFKKADLAQQRHQKLLSRTGIMAAFLILADRSEDGTKVGEQHLVPRSPPTRSRDSTRRDATWMTSFKKGRRRRRVEREHLRPAGATVELGMFESTVTEKTAGDTRGTEQTSPYTNAYDSDLSTELEPTMAFGNNRLFVSRENMEAFEQYCGTQMSDKSLRLNRRQKLSALEFLHRVERVSVARLSYDRTKKVGGFSGPFDWSEQNLRYRARTLFMKDWWNKVIMASVLISMSLCSLYGSIDRSFLTTLDSLLAGFLIFQVAELFARLLAFGPDYLFWSLYPVFWDPASQHFRRTQLALQNKVQPMESTPKIDRKGPSEHAVLLRDALETTFANRAETVILVASVVAFLITRIQERSFLLGVDSNVARFVTVLPILRVFVRVKRLRKITFVLFGVLPSFTTYFTLLLVIVYVYAVYGTAYLSGQWELFADTNGEPPQTNFETLGNSFVALFAFLVGGLSDTMSAVVQAYGLTAVIFFLSFLFVAVMLFSNLFISLVLGKVGELIFSVHANDAIQRQDNYAIALVSTLMSSKGKDYPLAKALADIKHGRVKLSAADKKTMVSTIKLHLP